MHPRSARQRVLKSAKIIFSDRLSVLDCRISNLSEGGACLQIASTASVPRTFALRLAGEPERVCQKVWTRDGRIGVRFV
jgi:hypothetical protein